jgi:hypothetical protein
VPSKTMKLERIAAHTRYVASKLDPEKQVRQLDVRHNAMGGYEGDDFLTFSTQ